MYELYSKNLRERVEKKRKDLYWMECEQSCVGMEEDGQGYNGSAAVAAKEELVETTNNNEATAAAKLPEEEQKARIEALQILTQRYKDYGQLIHCILYKDDQSNWQCGLIIDHQSYLLQEYSKNQSYVVLDELTISRNVWENGARLELVGICSGHGTHVGGIASGWFGGNLAKSDKVQNGEGMKENDSGRVSLITSSSNGNNNNTIVNEDYNGIAVVSFIFLFF